MRRPIAALRRSAARNRIAIPSLGSAGRKSAWSRAPIETRTGVLAAFIASARLERPGECESEQ